MDSPIEISIIIPVYNASKYLKKCIDSVLLQSYQNFELIIINDCSSDNSLEICKSYFDKSDKVKLINLTENKGVDNARFIGIKTSVGKFLMFVDSDDWIANNSLQILHGDIISSSADISSGAFVRVMDKFGLIRSKPRNMYGYFIKTDIEEPELMNDYFISYFGVNKLLVSMCGKLYRKSVILKANISQSNFRMGEDLIFNLSLHPFLRKISIVRQVVYYYRFGGMTTGINSTFFQDVLSQYTLKKKYATDYNQEDCIDTAKIEIKNCFKSHVKSMIRFKQIDNAKAFINFSLQDDRFIDCMNFYKNKTNIQDEFVGIVLSNDKDDIFNYCANEVRKERVKFFLKRFVSRLLS